MPVQEPPRTNTEMPGAGRPQYQGARRTWGVGITRTRMASEAWIRRDIALVADGQQQRDPVGNVRQR